MPQLDWRNAEKEKQPAEWEARKRRHQALVAASVTTARANTRFSLRFQLSKKRIIQPLLRAASSRGSGFPALPSAGPRSPPLPSIHPSVRPTPSRGSRLPTLSPTAAVTQPRGGGRRPPPPQRAFTCAGSGGSAQSGSRSPLPADLAPGGAQDDAAPGRSHSRWIPG